MRNDSISLHIMHLSYSGLQVNRVGFNVPAFGVRNGEMILQAAYEVVSPTRVAIALKEASLVCQIVLDMPLQCLPAWLI